MDKCTITIEQLEKIAARFRGRGRFYGTPEAVRDFRKLPVTDQQFWLDDTERALKAGGITVWRA